MLMRAEIVDDASALFAVDHVGIEAAGTPGVEGADPGDGFAAERIDVTVVFDLKGNVASALREHDATPGPHIQEGQGVSPSMPKLFHDAGSDGCDVVLAGEAEAALYFRMQAGEVGA